MTDESIAALESGELIQLIKRLLDELNLRLMEAAE